MLFSALCEAGKARLRNQRKKLDHLNDDVEFCDVAFLLPVVVAAFQVLAVEA